jgi:DNA polymerase III epsilon subunit family exonuclease
MVVKFILILLFLPLGIVGFIETITNFDGTNLVLAMIGLCIGVPVLISFVRDYKKHFPYRAKPVAVKNIPDNTDDEKKIHKYSDEEVLTYVKTLVEIPETECEINTVKRPIVDTRFLYNYAYEPLYSDFVVIDFETTGFSPANDKIIEIGAVKVIGGTVIDTFNSYVNPRQSIPKSITKINGINDQMVKDAPFIDQIMPAFISFIKDLPIVAHNASFDANFLKANSSASLDLIVADTLRFCRHYYPEFENHKLETVCRNLSIISDGYHRALNDCMVTYEVYLSCREQYLIENRMSIAHAAEKEGNMDEAVRLYELLIESNFEGNYPYDRLAIIYRKRKDYNNEVRVISHAIWVFENIVSPDRVDRDVKLAKFFERLEKAKLLMEKNAAAVGA